MVEVRTRDTEACDPQPWLLWDTVWVQRLDAGGGFGDWLMAGPEDPTDQAGGLRARHGLHTATMLCLFTDARAIPGTLPPYEDDPRGWWGDQIKFDDEPAAELGSLLWTLERGPLSEQTARLAKDYAETALAVLAEQGAVARTEVETLAEPLRGFLGILVRHFAHDGATVYQQRFEVVWDQEQRPAPMNFGAQPILS